MDECLTARSPPDLRPSHKDGVREDFEFVFNKPSLAVIGGDLHSKGASGGEMLDEATQS